MIGLNMGQCDCCVAFIKLSKSFGISFKGWDISINPEKTQKLDLFYTHLHTL